VETLGIQSKIKHIEAIKAVGDSMEPTIKDGALVLIDKSDVNIDKSGVFAVNASGSVYIKRISKSMSGMVEIISDNTLYPKESFTQEEVFVIGRILGLVERV
jgi:phage repressor protein C with HTH and peptisase S24 domain